MVEPIRFNLALNELYGTTTRLYRKLWRCHEHGMLTSATIVDNVAFCPYCWDKVLARLITRELDPVEEVADAGAGA